MGPRKSWVSVRRLEWQAGARQLQGFVDGSVELGNLDGFGQVAEKARSQAVADVALHGIGRQRDDGDVRRARIVAQDALRLVAIHAGQVDIHQDHIGAALQRQRDAMACVGGRDHAQMGQEADDVFHQPQAGRIVFHVQQQGLVAGIVVGVASRFGQPRRVQRHPGGRRGHGVEFDPEDAAHADAAVHAHGPAHQFDQALGDDQADARAFLTARLLAQPVKRLE